MSYREPKTLGFLAPTLACTPWKMNSVERVQFHHYLKEYLCRACRLWRISHLYCTMGWGPALIFAQVVVEMMKAGDFRGLLYVVDSRDKAEFEETPPEEDTLSADWRPILRRPNAIKIDAWDWHKKVQPRYATIVNECTHILTLYGGLRSVTLARAVAYARKLGRVVLGIPIEPQMSDRPIAEVSVTLDSVSEDGAVGTAEIEGLVTIGGIALTMTGEYAGVSKQGSRGRVYAMTLPDSLERQFGITVDGPMELLIAFRLYHAYLEAAGHDPRFFESTE